MTNIPEPEPLSGLLSWKSLKNYFADWAGTQKQFGLLLLDIDQFIYFNERYGHQKGDQKLRELGDLVSQTIPKEAIACRCGDEFVVLVGNRKMAEIVAVAVQTLETINQHFLSTPPLSRTIVFLDRSYLKFQAPLTVSGGLAVYPFHGASFETLLEAADTAMYLAGKSLFPKSVFGIARARAEDK